jgi:hypothetical protein
MSREALSASLFRCFVVSLFRYHALHRNVEPILRALKTLIIGIFDRQSVSEQAI